MWGIRAVEIIPSMTDLINEIPCHKGRALISA
jgi:hypothetical protein